MQSDLFRKQYDFELDQRNGLTSATNIPMVAITVVGSATSAILVDFRYAHDLQTYAFAAFASATLVAVVFSVYSVFRSFWNYDYKKLPRSSDLRAHFTELREWHSNNGADAQEVERLANFDFTEYISERIAEAADWNGQNNIVRGNYLHRATAAIATGVALLLPAALLYAYNKTTADEKIHQIKIVEPVPLKQPESKVATNQPNTGSTQPASAPAPAPAPAPKPSGPPNLVFKGNRDLTKPSPVPPEPRKK